MANPWLNRRVLHFAHQGGELEAPSNTLFAFKTAVAKGADALEMDLHATADGEIVVCHDPFVDRTTNGAGHIDSLTLEGVKELDAAYWFVPGRDSVRDAAEDDYTLRGVATGDRPPPVGSAAGDFTVPTLREVLEALPGVYLNMDIKRSEPDTSPYEEAVANLLREFGRENDVIVASFSDATIQTFRTIAPEVTTAAALDEAAAVFRGEPGHGMPAYHALQVPAVYGGRPFVTRELVERAHGVGVAVHPWTINDETQMRELIEFGVDGIMTARPTLLARILAEHRAG